MCIHAAIHACLGIYHAYKVSIHGINIRVWHCMHHLQNHVNVVRIPDARPTDDWEPWARPAGQSLLGDRRSPDGEPD
jgi:hypothetical protein